MLVELGSELFGFQSRFFVIFLVRNLFLSYLSFRRIVIPDLHHRDSADVDQRSQS